MHWNSLQEFLEMGGYALYVWGSFGVTFLLIALEVWQARGSWRTELTHLTDALQIEASLQDKSPSSRPSATLTSVIPLTPSEESGGLKTGNPQPPFTP
jgi:heme exporter protein D